MCERHDASGQALASLPRAVATQASSASTDDWASGRENQLVRQLADLKRQMDSLKPKATQDKGRGEQPARRPPRMP